MCVYPATPVLLASCSADTTLKLWTHEPKSLHSTKPLLQTLYGHTAAVTCVAAVHSFLVSGGADGAVLLWKPADSGLLAIPQFQLVAKLFSSEHWVLSLSCRLQPSEAGAAQGIFVAVANQPLLRLQLDKWAVQQAGRAGSSQLVQSCCQAQFFAQSNTGDFIPRPAKRCTEHSDQPAAASATGATAIHSLLKSQSSKSSRSNRQPVSFALRSNSPGSSMKPASQLPQSTDSAAAAAQDLSVFAVQFVAMELAVLTLAYDGCCRLHSAVDGGLRCCWRSPTGSRFTAMGCTEHDTRSEVLLGDERGMLHVYSLAGQQLLATKQLAHCRLEAIIVCSSRTMGRSRSTNSSSSGVSSGAGSSSTQFTVLTAAGLALWQLRRGLSHGILPGGHSAAVLAVQVCRANVQIALPPLVAAPDESANSAAAAATNTNSTTPDLAGGGSSSDVSSPACMMLVSGGLDNRVLQWDLAGGPSVLASLDVGQVGSELSAVTYLQGWSILATGHDGGQVVLWRLDTSSHLLLGPSHANAVCCLAPALTAKGDELLLSGSYDGCVSLWEPRHLRGVKPHLLARFQACGLTPAALLEACNLARLSSAAAGGASGGPGNSAADAAAAAAAAARRRKATMSAGRAMSAAGAAAAASRSCSPSMPGSPGPGPVNQRMLGMQRLADIGSSSSSYSLSGVTAQVGQLGSGCSSSAGGSSWSPKAVLYSQQQQAEVYSAKGAAGEGRRGLTTVLSGRRAGQLQPTVPPLQLRPAVFDVSGSSSSSRPGSPAAAAANRAAGSGLLQNNWVGGAATAADVLGDACDSEAELPEVLAVLFDSSKQLVVTAGNSGVIRVWSGSCAGELLGQHVGHTAPINCLTLDDNFLFSGSCDKTICMWDVLPPHFAAASSARASSSSGTTPRQQHSAAGAVASATQVGWADTCTGNGSTHGVRHAGSIGSAAGGAPRLPAPGGVPSSRAFQVLHGHTAAVTGLEVVQGNGVLVSCGRDGRLLQWDYVTGQLLAKQQLQGQELLCLAVRQDSRQVYVGSSTAQLLSFQVVDRQQCDAAEQSGADEAVHAPTCHDLARAVDSHTVTALCIKRWGASPFTGNTKRLFSVNTIQLLTKPDWDHLEKLAAGLQQLRTLQIPTHVNSRIGAACAAALTGLTRLDLGTNGKQVPGIPLPKHGTVQLACLKAASFSSSHSSKLRASAGNGTLQDIAAFAPNLEQLYCQCLEIDISSSSAANGSNVLPYCSHFGGQEVHIVGAASKAAGGAAFAKAFPKLRVISCLPHTINTAAEQKHHGKWSVAPGELLALRKSIHAVRGCGAHAARALDSTPSSSNSSSSRVAQLAAVSIHAGMSSSSTLLGVVGQLRQVQRLELLLGAPLSRHGPSPTHRASFLRDMQSILLQLPLLQLLALPAALLCSSCCNEGHGAAAEHAALLQTLEAVAGCSSSRLLARLMSQHQQHGAGGGGGGGGAAGRGRSSSSALPSLQQLVFVDAQWPVHSGCYAEECWQHPQQHQQRIEERFLALQRKREQQQLLQQLDGALTGSDVGRDCCAAQRDQHVQLQLHVGLVYGAGPCLDNSSGCGVWGVYGLDEFSK
uniref:Uncharacterized protein n=1 Tax=Tetradesmus obliquus TaxID=3088 RepID=A0A383VUZ7_TETOB